MYKQAKSLFLLAVVVFSALVSLVQFPDVAHAQGEAYKWTSGTTIEASGGKYKGKTTFVTATDQQFQGSSRELLTKDVNIDATMGDCDHAVGRIVLFGADESKAKLYIGSLAVSGGGFSECGTHRVTEQDMDEDISIAPQDTAGSGTNWATQDCSKISDGHEKTRCVAIKACVVTEKKPAKDCEGAWTSCMGPSKVDAAYTSCAQQISEGKTQNATYTPPKGDDKDTGTEDTCKIEGFGWIICPLVNFMANIVDAAYSFVASLLVVQPLLVTTTDGKENPIYGAWSTMRNFANIAFVIAFLLIIFSQLTSVGITNYGIKKMLPRLIVAAILVNVSFWVCAIAVDLTNIIGGSVNGLFHTISTSDGISGVTQTSFSGTGKGWTAIAGPILAGAIAGVAIYLSISALLPALVMALLAIVTVFLVLTIRQALIILLIVVSPLAFVAYLLPNTESLFKKWLGLFKTMLLMYPIIAALFGASALASAVIMQSADGKYAIVIQIMGALVSIVPLVLTPLVMKSAGSLLNKVGGFVNNPNRGPADWAKKRATATGERIENRRKIRGLQTTGAARFMPGSAKYRRQAEREAIDNSIASRAGREQSAYLAKAAQSDQVSVGQQLLSKATGDKLGGNTKGDQLLSAMSKGGGDDARNMALASAISTQRELEGKEEAAALTTLRSLNPDKDQLRRLSQGNSVDVNGTVLNAAVSHAVRAAAMQEVVDTHDIQGVNTLLDNVGDMSDKTREAFADKLDHSKEKPAYVSKSAIANIRQHGKDAKDENGNTSVDPTTGANVKVVAKKSTELTVDAINNNTYSVDKLANGDKNELAHVADTAEKRNIGVKDDARTKLKENATEASTNTRYAGQISKNIDEVTRLSNL